MRLFTTAVAGLFLFTSAVTSAQTPLLGFDQPSSDSQRALEQEFDSHLDAQDLDSWLREMSRTPHHVGSARGREIVEFICRTLSRMGLRY